MFQRGHYSEFSNAACKGEDRLISFSDKEISEVAAPIKELLPVTILVKVTPRHSKSNEGIE